MLRNLRPFMWQIGGIVLLGLYLPAPVSGGSVVLLQPPDYSSYGISDPQANRVFAEDFILTQETRISQVVVWGVNSDPTSPDFFTLILHRDDSELPGEALATFSDLVPAHRSQTGQSVGAGLPEYVYYISLPDPLVLPAGIWWIEVFNSAPGQLTWGWEGGVFDPIHGEYLSAIASEVPGDTWSEHRWNFSIMIIGSTSPIFTDGFEFGDTLSWSAWVPHCSENSDCDEAQFCKKKGCADLIGSCEPKPLFCPDVWDPVCGCDGRTYSNPCDAGQAGVNIASNGECPP